MTALDSCTCSAAHHLLPLVWVMQAAAARNMHMPPAPLTPHLHAYPLLAQVDPGYAPYDEGAKADVWMRGVDGKPYMGWVSACGACALVPVAYGCDLGIFGRPAAPACANI